MRLLFSVNNFGFLRNFEPALRLLAARGHHVHLVAERKDGVGGTRTIDNLTREYPDRVTFGYAPSRKDALWQPLAVQLRLALDYWRYLDPRYDRSPSLRGRAERQAPASAVRLARVCGSGTGLRLLQHAGRAFERALPAGDVVERFLDEQKPDLLLITPLLYFGSQQVEYVRAARARGIPTVLGVGSWDHLTTKGLIHEIPDRVVVWNDMQRQEAAVHGVAADRVTVTGAPAYDHWFAARPSFSREAFCAKVGLPAARPLLLYLCSSPFITPYEVGFVRRWIDEIRRADDATLRGASILIRPHPQNAAQWGDFDPSVYEAVGIWPRAGANPVDAEARADYFDSMYYSAAVVGVNTSALIESGIVGRPVFTVLADEFAGQQEGTLHFQHLKNVNGGLLNVASTMSEHVTQLTGALAGSYDAGKSRAFVEAFIRPHGFDTPAADRFVEVIEAEASTPRPASAPGGASMALRRLLMRPAAVAARAWAKRRKAAGREEPERRASLKILFALASPEYLRYFDSTMRLLADQGHRVAVGVNWLRERKHARLHLMDDERIELIGIVPKRTDVWQPLARAVRGTMDFMRYLHPRFGDTPVLRQRMFRKVLPGWLRWIDRYQTLSEHTLSRWLRRLQGIERAIPVGRRVAWFLRTNQPDVVVVSPLIDAASDQVDVVRAARAAGTPVIAAIASWDNLTNKGLMRVEPDVVTVWNEFQKAEAVELHGVAPEHVRVTGAQLFDRWFDREPSQARPAFCAMVGLPDARPFVLFTGSSVFIARSDLEVPFVRRWIEALRASEDPALRDVAVLVRPHPFNPDAWITADFTDLGPVAIWPQARYTPAAEDARTSFFDSLYYCEAIVGINTSAMIEGAILRKPVLALVTPDFAGTQEGTIHFRYLLPENGGFLRVASSIPAHVIQLGEVLRDPGVTRRQTEQFVARFLRPHGLHTACTRILADVIAQTGRSRPEPERDRIASKLLRVPLFPVAVLVKCLDLGEDFQRWGWKAIYETYDFLRKKGRLAAKRLFWRPGQLVRRWTILLLHRMVKGVRLARRVGVHAVRRALLSLRVVRRGVVLLARIMRRQPHRALHVARQLRYQLAIRFRGAPPEGVEESDVR